MYLDSHVDGRRVHELPLWRPVQGIIGVAGGSGHQNNVLVTSASVARMHGVLDVNKVYSPWDTVHGQIVGRHSGWRYFLRQQAEFGWRGKVVNKKSDN